MGARQTTKVTQLPELQYQMEHPSREFIWERALEVFGTEDKARHWMRNPLPILDHCTPEQYSLSNEPDKQRQVLAIIGRIDFGIIE